MTDLQQALADLHEGTSPPLTAPGRLEARERWFAWRAARIEAGLCEFCESVAGTCGHAHSLGQP